MSAAVLYAGLAALKTAMATATGVAATSIREVPADAVTAEPTPVIAFVPGKFTVEWATAEEASIPSASTQLVCLGVATGPVEIRVMRQHPAQREALQDLVMAMFMSQDGSPGSYTAITSALTIQGVATGHTATVAFDLMDYEWNEERVFETARYSFMTCTATVPVLYLRGATAGTEVHTIEAVQMAWSADIDTLPASAATVLETVQVSEDGYLEAPDVFP